MSMFTEKLASTIGPTYVISFFFGAALGLTKIPPPKNRRTYKLLLNSYINNVGKTSSRFGNNMGGCILMYLMVGKFANFLFLEEFEDVGIPVQNALFGAATGALYKSTRGRQSMILASVLGATVGSIYGSAWSKGYFRFSL